MVTAIMFLGLLMSGILGYNIHEAENMDPAKLEKPPSGQTDKPAKHEPNPWAM